MLPEITADAAVTTPAAVNMARQPSPAQAWKPPMYAASRVTWRVSVRHSGS
jgi:hypothetical protein